MQTRLTHFREILRYVPRFRDRVFVIAIDGAVVEDENFPNLLLDIALLRSLSIRVVLVHGAAHQVQRYAERLKVTPSDVAGLGITDRETLQVAITAANRPGGGALFRFTLPRSQPPPKPSGDGVTPDSR